ncbi:MAG: helix-turn-helix domain-containing protein [Rhodococcus sp. (in: high G+C Gram-positive bacteria)]|uniref:hypothetical protein n=1 Tax=Rhodococcus sp. TaxID=1831 RepID=UPI003BB80260
MTTAVAQMGATEARALTDQIKVAVEATWELVKRAYVERAWAVLGYDGWDDYCTREFGTSRLRLPREERAEVVASLRESGLSTRAIAAATGLSQKTVSREVAAGESNDSPVIGTDGKTYTPKSRQVDQVADADNLAGQAVPSFMREGDDEIAPGISANDLAALNDPPAHQSSGGRKGRWWILPSHAAAWRMGKRPSRGRRAA